MPSIVDLLAAGQKTEDTRNYVGSVTAISEDGKTVNAKVRGGTLLSVPCLASYTPRTIGDRVTVQFSRAGALITGLVGTEYTPPPEETPPPSSGSGSVVKVTCTAQQTYRGGVKRNDVDGMVQGDYHSGYGNNEGCAFYGTALHDAVAAGAVASATIPLARIAAKHGIYQGANVKMYVIDSASAPGSTPGGTAGPWTIGKLELGELKTFTVPAAALTKLAGTGRGFCFYSTVANDYIRFKVGYADVTITYA